MLYGIGERGKGLNYFWLINERCLPRTMGFGRRQFFLFSAANKKQLDVSNDQPFATIFVRCRAERMCVAEKKRHTQYWKCRRRTTLWKYDPGARVINATLKARQDFALSSL